jgi:hypothetical protein
MTNLINRIYQTTPVAVAGSMPGFDNYRATRAPAPPPDQATLYHAVPEEWEEHELATDDESTLQGCENLGADDSHDASIEPLRCLVCLEDLNECAKFSSCQHSLCCVTCVEELKLRRKFLCPYCRVPFEGYEVCPRPEEFAHVEGYEPDPSRFVLNPEPDSEDEESVYSDDGYSDYSDYSDDGSHEGSYDEEFWEEHWRSFEEDPEEEPPVERNPLLGPLRSREYTDDFFTSAIPLGSSTPLGMRNVEEEPPVERCPLLGPLPTREYTDDFFAGSTPLVMRR